MAQEHSCTTAWVRKCENGVGLGGDLYVEASRSETCQGRRSPAETEHSRGRECWEREIDGCGQELGPGERVGDVARVVRLGLRGCAEDFRPYPRSNMKLLRGFKQLRE